jgi:hypothetical protein
MDAAVERIMAQAESGAVDEQRTAMIALAVNYVEHLMAERRDLLLRPSGRLAGNLLGAGGALEMGGDRPR